MANIPIPENDDSLELNVRYQPDMVLEGMLDATVPEMKYLRLSQGNETYDLLGAQSGDQVLELLSEDLTAAEEGKVLTVVEDDSGDTPVYNAEWADAPSGLPEIEESDEGKVLTVDQGEAVWTEPSGGSGVPTPTSADYGKFLTVGNDYIIPKQTVTFVADGDVAVASLSNTKLDQSEYSVGDTIDITIVSMGQSSDMTLTYGYISAISLDGFSAEMMGQVLFVAKYVDEWKIGLNSAQMAGLGFEVSASSDTETAVWSTNKIVGGEYLSSVYFSDGTTDQSINMIVLPDKDYNVLNDNDLVFAYGCEESPVAHKEDTEYEYLPAASSHLNAYIVKTTLTLEPRFSLHQGTVIISESMSTEHIQYRMG